MTTPSQNDGPSPPPEVPKESSPANSQEPPPAYTPPLRTRLQASLAAIFNNNPNITFAPGFINNIGVGAPRVEMLDEDSEEEDHEVISPISLRISARINVSRDQNIIALSFTPAEQANAIAEAVVAAIKSNSTANCGIPMIDEDGRPRPIKIEVDAGISVEGTGNVIGTAAIVSEVLRQRGAVIAAAANRRRRRAAEEEDGPEQPSSKRARSLE